MVCANCRAVFCDVDPMSAFLQHPNVIEEFHLRGPVPAFCVR